ncbi:hypothetical protein LTR56_026364 [Elasticomyces elasticus]|nr:hypothetical protein LTR56_026364 [Elasticomyces elasticus]KAK3619365.1 hypothetical protein LTR22_026005 [Elasticomyces elasticus]KAK4904462.1 hypothetical protein LTR49_026093 [Elasticomyces elasticus]
MARLLKTLGLDLSDHYAVYNDSAESENVRSSKGPYSSVRQDPAAVITIDKSLYIRTACLVALGFSYAVALASIAASIYLYVLESDLGIPGSTPDVITEARRGRPRPWCVVTNISPWGRSILDFVLSAVITICTEGMGYIHSVTLRWALLREGRLQYSSSLRLISSARRSWPNSRWANTLSSVALVFSYAGASQTLVPYTTLRYSTNDVPLHGALANGPALLLLGLGLLVQALLSTACLLKDSARIPTWSSNVLTITLACLLEQDRTFRRQEGRCLQSAFDTVRASGEAPFEPRLRQPSVRSSDSAVRHITRFVWFLTAATFAWAITVAVLIAVLPKQAANVNGYFPNLNLEVPIAASLFLTLVIVAVFQTFATMGLHSVELLVNRSRDEQCWRHASTTVRRTGTLRKDQIGSKKAYNSITAAFTSWQSLGLYFLKPLVHWLFGSSLSTSNTAGTSAAYMNNHFIFALGVAILILATFATLLSRHRPSGVIPSTWGHIQTLANLVDDWGDGTAGKLYWGDKGLNEDGTRHAGTASDAPLPVILPNGLYR